MASHSSSLGPLRIPQWLHHLLLPLAGLLVTRPPGGLDGLPGLVPAALPALAAAAGLLAHGYAYNLYHDGDRGHHPLWHWLPLAPAAACWPLLAWPGRLALPGAVVISLLYSGPLRLKALPLLGTLLNAAWFPLLCLLGMERVTPGGAALLGLCACWLGAAQLVHELAHRADDLAQGVATTGSRLGTRWTMVLAASLLLAAAAAGFFIHRWAGAGLLVYTAVFAGLAAKLPAGELRLAMRYTGILWAAVTGWALVLAPSLPAVSPGPRPSPAHRRPTAAPRTTEVRVTRLAADTRWTGRVLLSDLLTIPRGITLTIDPGTTVLFSPYRGYQRPDRRLGLLVKGRLLALGRRDAPVRFTSASPAPANGDWSTIRLLSSSGNKLTHAVVEFARRGLHLSAGQADLTHVVLRFHNEEGLFLEDRSRARLQGSRVYGNGGSCVAVEGGSHLAVQGSYLARCSSAGVGVNASTLELSGSLVEGCVEGVTLDKAAAARVTSSRFAGMEGRSVGCGAGALALALGGVVHDGAPMDRRITCPPDIIAQVKAPYPPLRVATGAVDPAGGFLAYLPGNPDHDPYLYVYPDRDETREVDRKLGGGLGPAWSVAWDGTMLWTATREGKLLGLDPQSGAVRLSHKSPGPGPWGMAFDGRRLWVNDYLQGRIHRLDPATGRVEGSIPSPDPSGECRGLAFAGGHLYALGWRSRQIYKLDREGRLLDTIPSPSLALDGGEQTWVSGGLTFDGQAFWGAAGGRLVRFDRVGRVLGWIHGTSEQIWGLAWDGRGVWTAQSGHESWEGFDGLRRITVLKLQN